MDTLHEMSTGDGHRFILQHHDHDHITKSDEEDDRYDRVCDACLKIINAPDDPFYSCSICPNFFLHDFCYRIPILLTANPAAREPEHRFLYIPRDYIGSHYSICSHCSCRYIRAFYVCHELNSFTLDVSCALMPSVVTHEAHGTSHFLRLTKSSSRSRANCDCCSRSLDIKLAYECRTCPNFALHTWCAMLPKTVTHKFDPHPLHLVTAATATKRRNISVGVSDICEICEHEIDDEVWYYGCERCEQSFHVDCIPCLDLLYKIKSLVSVGRMRDGGVPTRLIL